MTFRMTLVVGCGLVLVGLWGTLSWLGLSHLRQSFQSREASAAVLWMQTATRRLQAPLQAGRPAEAERLARVLAAHEPHYTFHALDLLDDPVASPAAPRPRMTHGDGVTRIEAPVVFTVQTREGGQAVEKDGTLTFTESIGFEDKLYGQWIIEVSHAAFQNDLREVQTRFLQVGAAALAAFAGVLFLLSGRLTRPVAELVRLGGRVEQGELTVEAVPTGPAELRRAITAANAMMHAVRRREEDQQEQFDALQRLQTETENLVKLQANFTAAVSHELRTPLVGIEGYSRLLKDQLQGQPAEDAGKILTSALHLKTLINTLLDTMRLSRGELTLNPRPTDLSAVMKNFRQVIAYDLRRCEATLHEDLTLPEGRVLLDPDRLLQIMLNLVGNALKHAAKRPVTLVLTHTGDTLTLEVRDEGGGIAKEEHGRIFEPFVQLPGDGAKPEGTGLGLFIVRQLARNMGGDVRVDSDPAAGRKGATFSVTVVAPRVTP